MGSRSTRSQCVENSLWKRLWTCRKADCGMNECGAEDCRDVNKGFSFSFVNSLSGHGPQSGHGPHLFRIIVFCVVLVIVSLCCSVVIMLYCYSVALLLFVLSHVLIVCTVPLPSGVNPIAVDKYIYKK